MNTYRISITQIDEQGNETAWHPERIQTCNGFAMLLVDKQEREDSLFNAQTIIEELSVLHLAAAITEDCHLKRAAKLAIIKDAFSGMGEKTEEESEAE